MTFREPVAGPLVVGDGRYCGLGIMAPVACDHRDALILPVRKECRPPVAHRATVVNALRRALMSRGADAGGNIPTLFCGHDEGGGRALSGQHRHVYLFAEDDDGDGRIDRLAVIAPWRVDRSWTPNDKEAALFEETVSDLRCVRAGAAGVLALDNARTPDPDDPLFACARKWRSRTTYRPTRHARSKSDGSTAAAADLLQECLRRGLPRPEVEVVTIDVGPHGGCGAQACLHFNIAVAGPILLGLDAHRGGGLFEGRR